MSTGRDKGRVAVIAGASSGIGEATARALAASGLRLALQAHPISRLQFLAEELGDGVIAIPCDVTDRDALVAASARVEADWAAPTYSSTTPV